jgi:hypothetical protein
VSDGIVMGRAMEAQPILTLTAEGQVLCRDDSGRMIAVRLGPQRLARLLGLRDAATRGPGGAIYDILAILCAELAEREQ